jgi:hypothetical protein
MKIGIILTGIIEDYYLNDLIDCYKDCLYEKIISTWDYTDVIIINKLKENGFHIIQSTFPDDIYKCTTNYQNYSFKMGIQKVKELDIGITYVLRMRSDLVCTDINKLLQICEKVYDENKLIFSFYFRRDLCEKSNFKYNTTNGYIMDLLYFGNIQLISKYGCCIRDKYDYRFIEKFNQEMCFSTSNYKKLRKQCIFIGKELIKNNIELTLKCTRHLNITVFKPAYDISIAINNSQYFIDNKLNIETYDTDLDLNIV